MSDLSALNKDICKRCRNGSDSKWWDEFDDDDWNNGIIYCPDEYEYDDVPSKNCPYRLEHIMVMQREIVI